MNIIATGLNIRGKTVTVFDTNPYLRYSPLNSIRVTIQDLPLSIHDNEIRSSLEKLGCKIIEIQKQKGRVNGKLTSVLNGDRVAYIDKTGQTLPKAIFVNGFRARVYHPGQSERVLTCSRCLETGHYVKQCHGLVVCRHCKLPGHKQSECPNSLQEESETIISSDSASDSDSEVSDNDIEVSEPHDISPGGTQSR